MKTFYISIKFIVAFHVAKLHLPVNSIICKHEKIPFKTSQRRVYPARGQSLNKNSQKRKGLEK